MNILKKVIQIILLILLVYILGLNLHKFNMNYFSIEGIVVIILIFSFYFLYKKNLINNKNSKYILISFIIVGLIIRGYYFLNLNFELESDFLLYYETAISILNGENFNNAYLAFNGYVVMVSNIFAFFLFLFGKGVSSVIIGNVIVQIITTLLLYKVIIKYTSKPVGTLLSGLYFIMPVVIFTNFLVATETIFMLFLILTIIILEKIKNLETLEVNKKSILYIILLGIIMAVSNNIRPIMLILLIALVIYYILTIKKLREILSLVIIILTYTITSSLINIYIENRLDMELRPGATEWSLYFGANKEYCGSWTVEDSEYAFEILEEKNGSSILIDETINRYKSYGISGTSELMNCKYTSLWTTHNTSLDYVSYIIDEESLAIVQKNYETINNVNLIIYTAIISFSIIAVYSNIKNNNHKLIILQLFTVGYILSNLLVVLNGRYSFPAILLLIIIAANKNQVEKIKMNTKEEMETQKKAEKILLIIPAYNEEENIVKTINSIEKSKQNIDYIIINDGSTDKTKEICAKNNFNTINLIHNLGIGGAVQTGYKYALVNNYDVAIQFDGDGQHDVNYVKELIKPIKSGADFVIGSRFVDINSSEFKSTAMRQVGIKIISKFIKLISNQTITDPTSGFRAANKNVIKIFAEKYPIEYPEPICPIILKKYNLKIEEVAVKMHARENGESSIKSWKSVYYMINVILLMIITNMKGGK